MSKRAVIIGGGAAGMFTSIRLGEQGMDVTVLEKNEKLGKKIFITGKGRCNFTNTGDESTFFASVMRNPKFLYSAYHAFGAQDAVDFFEESGMPVKVERGNRAFPVSDHAYDVTDALKKRMKRVGVKVILNAEVQKIEIGSEKKVTGVICTTKNGTEFIKADRVIVATGGLSYPSTGSTGDGYRFAEETGHTVVPTAPSLVPMITKEDTKELAGLSLKNVTLSIFDGNKTLYSGFGEMLFTHSGISGPLVLTASSVLAGSKADFPLRTQIDLKPKVSAEEFDKRILRLVKEQKDKNLSNLFRELYPASMIKRMLDLCGLEGNRKAYTLTRAEREAIIHMTKRFPLTVTGSAGYAEAVITRGGVSVKDIDPKTMMSKKIKGLYFAGEVIDVDALTGGFNLQIAWSTANAAGNAPDCDE